MTHGDFGTISSFDEDYSIEIVTSFFTDEKCPSLKGKPRLFFIQACRGGLLDSGHHMRELRRKSAYALKKVRNNDSQDIITSFEMVDEIDDQLHNPPNHRDFLVVRSTMPNYLSFRNPDTGSWFVSLLAL